eukprot:695246-Hanusia_phi.AAC.2
MTSRGTQLKITDAFTTPKTALKPKPDVRFAERDSEDDCLCIADEHPTGNGQTPAAAKTAPSRFEAPAVGSIFRSELASELFASPLPDKIRNEKVEFSKSRIVETFRKDPIMDLTVDDPDSRYSSTSSILNHQVTPSLSATKIRVSHESAEKVQDFDFTLPCSPPRPFRHTDIQPEAVPMRTCALSSSRRSARALSLQSGSHESRERTIRPLMTTTAIRVNSNSTDTTNNSDSVAANHSMSIRGSWSDHIPENEFVDFSSDGEEENQNDGSEIGDSDSDISSIVGMLLTDEQLARMRDMRQNESVPAPARNGNPRGSRRSDQDVQERRRSSNGHASSQSKSGKGHWITERYGALQGQYRHVFVDGDGRKLTGKAAWAASQAAGVSKSRKRRFKRSSSSRKKGFGSKKFKGSSKSNANSKSKDQAGKPSIRKKRTSLKNDLLDTKSIKYRHAAKISSFVALRPSSCLAEFSSLIELFSQNRMKTLRARYPGHCRPQPRPDKTLTMSKTRPTPTPRIQVPCTAQ